jgi:hypothetical protein
MSLVTVLRIFLNALFPYTPIDAQGKQIGRTKSARGDLCGYIYTMG